MENNKVLYQKGAYGGFNVWQIWSVANVIHIHANGCEYTEVIHEGKAGRSVFEQVKLRINARVRSKLDSGFKDNKEEASNFTNQLGLPLPMLAKKLKDIKNLDMTKCFIQNKFDGHRCLVTKVGGNTIAYSRRGKMIDTIKHITDNIDIPEGIVLDGELYCHGERLQTIASWAKRLQPNTSKIRYHVYDCFVPGEDIPYRQRLFILNNFVFKGPVEKVATIKFDPSIKLMSYFEKARVDGYEGLILRPSVGFYGIGKRTDSLIKVKKREDAEFEILDVIPSREGLGILILSLGNGKSFKTVAPGDNSMKRHILEHKRSYIGKMVTCEFAERTRDGVPFHCVAMRIRGDL